MQSHIRVSGYSTHTLGVKSNCRLRYIPNIPQKMFTLEVIPALPILEVSCTLIRGARKKVCEIIFVVFICFFFLVRFLPHRMQLVSSKRPTLRLFCTPERSKLIAFSEVNDLSANYIKNIRITCSRSECTIRLKNTGTIPVEFLDVSVESMLEQNLQRQIIQWDRQSVQEYLPLNTGSAATFSLNLFGAANFLAQPSNAQGERVKVYSHLLSKVYSKLELVVVESRAFV